jgi:hypothetical protein
MEVGSLALTPKGREGRQGQKGEQDCSPAPEGAGLQSVALTPRAGRT